MQENWEKSKEAVDKKTREQIFEEIESRKLLVDKTSILSENNGQLIVRIPKKVQNALELKKGDKIRFMVNIDKEKREFSIEVVGHGKG
ncbi:MAG: hypothetical protein ABIJ10_07185 [Candidatus Micrarchaeota archaeon]